MPPPPPFVVIIIITPTLCDQLHLLPINNREAPLLDRLIQKILQELLILSLELHLDLILLELDLDLVFDVASPPSSSSSSPPFFILNFSSNGSVGARGLDDAGRLDRVGIAQVGPQNRHHEDVSAAPTIVVITPGPAYRHQCGLDLRRGGVLHRDIYGVKVAFLARVCHLKRDRGGRAERERARGRGACRIVEGDTRGGPMRK